MLKEMMWKSAVVVWMIIVASSARGRQRDADRDGWNHEAISNLASDASVDRKPFASEKSKETAQEFADEIAELMVAHTEDGKMELEFKSHGRVHKLNLKESRQRLDKVTVQLIGSNEEEQERVKNTIKGMKLMQDTKFGAVVVVKEDADGITESVVKSGVFTLGKHEFHILPESGNKAKIRKRSMDEITQPTRGRKVPNELKRLKRSEEVDIIRLEGIVEMLFITDYALWEKFSDLEPTDPYVGLVLYVAQMVAVMDSHYGSMQNDDLSIEVRLATIMVLASPNAAPELIEDHTQNIKGQEYIDGDQTLDRLTTWLYNNSDSIGPFDHAMLLTYRDLYVNGDTDKVGIAWVESICQHPYSSSFVEVRDTLTLNAITATHELGHSLGSDHEGEDFSFYCEDRNYIMAQSGRSNQFLENQFRFSCCSQRSFYATMRRNESQCVFQLTATSNYPPIIDTYTSDLPGQTYDADDQCYMAYGTTACNNASLVGDTDICLALFCVDPFAPENCITEWTGAADGTPCDENKWCYQGKCVYTNETYLQPDQNCDVRGCYGFELRCRQGVNTFLPLLFLCYPDVWVCDGWIDCSCGSDEENCPLLCPVGLSPCPSGNSLDPYPNFSPRCIEMTQICDGTTHCVDGSDEAVCPPVATTITPPVVECDNDEVFQDESGTIVAPVGVGDNYANLAHCNWSIQAPAGKVVEVTFARSDTIEDDMISCSYDFILLLNGYGDGEIARLCGDVLAGESYVSVNDIMEIAFVSDSQVTYRKWKLDWQVVCPGPDPLTTSFSSPCGSGIPDCSAVTLSDCNNCLEVSVTCCNQCDSL